MTIAHDSVPLRTRDALTAARLYYLQDLTMEAIARELATSRSSVSRLLTFARDTGLVEITVRSPREMPSLLEGELRRRFGMVAHVVPMPDGTSDVDRRERVALYTARVLGQYFESNMTMGIAWGSTMSAISRHLIDKPTHNSQIVQLNGAGNPRTTGIIYASEILQQFGAAFGATVQQFPVPAFFDHAETKAAMWRESSVRRVLDLQAEIDIALFGLGAPFGALPSHVYTGGYLDQHDLDQLHEHGVVGDLATVFYREDGSVDGIPLNERASGPDPSVLKRVARRVCVVSGVSKVPSIRGALAGGFVTDLVIDAGTARALLEES
ncbi:MAG: sugar-binding transcriptional regulator [Acidobacteria bacterium]|nr:sugar-binding transcriptional regulator [Acidobacteriota bacterium]